MTDYRDISTPNERVQNQRGYVAPSTGSGGNLVWVLVAAAVIAFGALFFLSADPTNQVDPNLTTSSISDQAPAADGAGPVAAPAQPSAEPAPVEPVPATPGQ